MLQNVLAQPAASWGRALTKVLVVEVGVKIRVRRG